MGKTRNTGKLATQIQFDNSNNLVIGNSTSSSSTSSSTSHGIGSSFITDTFLNSNLNQQSHGHHQITSHSSTDFDEYSNMFSESLQSSNHFQNSTCVEEEKSNNSNGKE